MSVLIARVQKYSAGSVKGIEIHNQREKNGVSHTNPDIDWEKTAQNYDLHNDKKISFYKIIKEKIQSLHLPKAPRKDAVVLAEYLVTSDKTFFDGISTEQRDLFFKDSYNFLAERYGKNNVISAVVHLDERTPHMHFSFVPITSDNRLAAKSIITRTELKSIQTDFANEVGKKYGLERGLEGSKAKHVETARLKERTAYQEAEELSVGIEALKNKKNALEGEIDDLTAIKTIVVPVKEKKSLISGAITEVTMKKDVYDGCVAAQYRAARAEMNFKRAEERAGRLEKSSNFSENLKMKAEIQKLKIELKEAKETVSKVSKILSQDAALEKRFFEISDNLKSQNKDRDLQR